MHFQEPALAALEPAQPPLPVDSCCFFRRHSRFWLRNPWLPSLCWKFAGGMLSEQIDCRQSCISVFWSVDFVRLQLLLFHFRFRTLPRLHLVQFENMPNSRKRDAIPRRFLCFLFAFRRHRLMELPAHVAASVSATVVLGAHPPAALKVENPHRAPHLRIVN